MVLNVAFELDVFVIRVLKIHVLFCRISDEKLVQAEKPHVIDIT